jgi:carbamoyl-phosphate synthase small subunit
MEKEAILLLADGTVFNGVSIGAEGTTTGEICFNTGMTGYQEVFTDPSYHGQIVTCTNVHIGNYGVHDDEVESNSVKIKGMICRDFSKGFSRERSEKGLQEYLESQGIVSISNVDTRRLVRHIRDNGAMNCIISSEGKSMDELKTILDQQQDMKGMELASKVSCKEAYDMRLEGASHRVAVLDLGVKQNILRCLQERGAALRVFPYNTSVEEIMAWNPDGIMLSNGPGDPEPLTDVISNVAKIIDTNIPVFGICLGHQIIGLSQGLKTFKMFNGHRGINHPVKNLITGKCEVTSQNHGFAIDRDSLPEGGDVEVTHVHLNDNTVAGIRLTNKPVFSVQYHPEANPGPEDSRYLFDQFIENLAKVTA